MTDRELINEQIEQLRERQHTQSIKIINEFCFFIAYSPQITNSPYSHLVFNIKVTLPEKYPDAAPYLFFMDKIYHLNVDPISGQVNMPILRDDWSPFLTLSAVFQSLDNILEEPDINYAATESLKAEYKNDPEKYANKVNQMVNLCTTEGKENLNHSVVEHVEEIGEFKSSQGMIFNNSFQKPEQEDPSPLLNSLPYSEIQKGSKEEKSNQVSNQKGNQIRIQTMSERQSVQKEKAIQINLNEFNVQKQVPKEEVTKPLTIDAAQNDKMMGQSLNALKLSLSKKRSQSPERKEDFDQIQINLKKSDQLIELLLSGCESMENTLSNSRHPRIRQLLEKKLEQQWKMVEDLLQMSSRLKQKLFNDLRVQTRHLLK